MEIRFSYTILYVEDVKKTIEFYNKAFGFETKFITPENDYAELLSGETTLSFVSVPLGESNLKDGFQKSTISQKPFGMNLTFTTDKIDEFMSKALENGALLLAKPKTKPWGQTVGYIKDINGFIIEIGTPMS